MSPQPVKATGPDVVSDSEETMEQAPNGVSGFQQSVCRGREWWAVGAGAWSIVSRAGEGQREVPRRVKI